MKLTRLRLIGFKSFVEPTDFEIEPGLTGVVGPNGCGKSNLVEAVRWVMGETSYKAMRAGEMDDVIFSGNAGRPGRNHAEVAVSIDNGDRRAPATFNEFDTLEVSRRIMREHGSTFRVNGKEVRARDVSMLFADASTGSRSPALVHQGRIGEIIQARPEARRRVLEEAAGIAGLHARRHEAELRLKAAEQNLARAEDVIGQLATQMASLKTQARQAVRYRNISGQVRRTEALLFHLRWIGAGIEVTETEHAKDEAVRVVAERTSAQLQASTKQAEVSAVLPGLREAEAKAAAALQRLLIARETLEREEARAKERIGELDRRIAQYASDLERERALAADAQAALARLDDEEAALKAVGAGERCAACRRQSARRCGRRRARRVGKILLRTDRRARRPDGAAQSAAGGSGRTRAARGAARIRARQYRCRPRRNRFRRPRSRNADGGAGAGAVSARRSRTGRPCRGSRAQDRRARRSMPRARRSPPPNAACSGSKPRPRRSASSSPSKARISWPPVMDALTVSEGYEKALGAALGDDLDAPVDQTAPMRWAGAGPDPSDPALPEGVTALSQYVKAPAELARRLAQIGVVERADGARLVGGAQARPAARLARRRSVALGRFCRRGARADRRGAAARRTRTAAGDRRRTQRRAARCRAKAPHGGSRGGRCRRGGFGRDRGPRPLARGAAPDRHAREDHAAAEREISRNAARISALQEARQRTIASRDETQAARREADTAFAALPPAAEIEDKLAAINEAIAAERNICAEVRVEAQAITREVETAHTRLQAVAAERQAWTERKDSAAAQIDIIVKRNDEAVDERTELESAPQKFESQRQALIGEIETATGERRAAADRLAAAEADLGEADKAARIALEAVGEARAESARSEERYDAAKRRVADIEHEIRELLSVEPAAAAEVAELKPDAPQPSIPEVEAKIERIKQERERLGSVNLLAEQELQDVEAQHTTLTAERDDLIEAIRRLRQGIHSLNHEARERLLSSFQIVNENFKKLFAELFGGGTAELQLIEAEDPLEAGLEIMAKPPGKKPATLSLLSGGEQALTALALIFAVFLTNPAPICVLDEVDAPLDDYNVERFCDLLDEMARSTDTRFIIITHNPITMARMKRLYGVTMAERGVSQLVSVDLEGAVKLREAS